MFYYKLLLLTKYDKKYIWATRRVRDHAHFTSYA